MKEMAKYCPNCGTVTENNTIEKWGVGSQTSGLGSCKFLECNSCKFQFNVREPYYGFIEDPKPKVEFKRMGRRTSRRSRHKP